MHRQRDQQRPGCSPADVIRRVGNVVVDELVELIRELSVRGEQEADEQWACLPVQKRSRAVMLIIGGIRQSTLEFESAQRSCGEVEGRLGMAASPQCGKCPDHAGRTGIQNLRRLAPMVLVPRVRGPKRVETERYIGVGDNRRDGVFNARRNPRVVEQTVELVRLVEHRLLLVDPAFGGRSYQHAAAKFPRHALCRRGREIRINYAGDATTASLASTLRPGTV